jgi:translation elongation factor EF-Tu-like GTPase
MGDEGRTTAFAFTVQHVFYIKPPVNRHMLVGMVESGTVRPATPALLHAATGVLPFTIEGVELYRAGDTPEATAGQQVALRCVGLQRGQADSGMRVTAARLS